MKPPLKKGINIKTTENKVWGTALTVHNNGLSKTSVLYIEKGGTCSWHYHNHRYNAFYVISGEIIILYSLSGQIDSMHELHLLPGDDAVIEPGDIHEFVALKNSVVIEVDYADNSACDIVRLRRGFKAKKLEG